MSTTKSKVKGTANKTSTAEAPVPPIVQLLKSVRRVSTPLVGIETPDPQATIDIICRGLNSGAPKIVWDVAAGLTARNEKGSAVIKELVTDYDKTEGNPPEVVQLAHRLPDSSILFIQMANRFLDDPLFVQAIANLRDRFKQNKRTLILLGPSLTLPPELTGDVVMFSEDLPDAEHIAEIIREQHKAANVPLKDEDLARAVEATQGLPAFQVEQIAAMSLTPDGLDVDSLWERKRKQIEQTPGLKVFRGAETFADVGGVAVVKDFVSRVMKGRSRPNAVVFIDEIEKMMAGALGGGGDTSGVSQDQLGTLLQYMQDNAAAGMIFVGPPGSAKSMVAKAAGEEAGVPTIQLDLGAAKGSLVGKSEEQLRTALRVISAVSNGRSVWIATCNSISDLPPELRRRFTLGTFFFDIPTAEERRDIWQIQARRFDHDPDAEQLPDDRGWTGAEIRQCCDIAYRLEITLEEAAHFVVPVSKSAADRLEQLRKMADGRFLSASSPGIYSRESANEPAPKRGRKVDFTE